ncbi:DEHA2A12276p [Debaryomyces hansenii CBS767]|uniref:DEHA2A12276p n=1 Tax=Debaryomyces hansenii (strain ATCC 36239 / CBS 767 / BCRC 21394 / JCM 1990 / NBRC 0083 / IGC 2968) TaxID=284592 RepID=Q6BY55_DEBHA|nr:DEHA2A12276p [Debaryomyces hansenii CBS767]CAG84839.2 DEHA2A12276p [Debaryomyces hansenii CBS767]|eukprot:XP_456864.2 DEHA2A12276p [Debaryomyces hansenii CBS767]
MTNEDDLAVYDEPRSARQEEFDSLNTSVKLERLNTLIQRSQVYSQIMAENILQNTMDKKQARGIAADTSENHPSKRRKGVKRQTKTPKHDVVSMLSAPSAEMSTHKQPRLFSGGTLKDYQLDGMEWLITLFENGLNGILADEMGLGKTIQCIAFLTFLMENGINGPFLIVVPLSTISNWCNEVKRFAPSLKMLKYIGSKQERSDLAISSDYNIVLTSYEISIRDFSKLNRINWKYLIVDEGHRLKNMNCTLIKFLKKLNVNNKLLITGTPLQNNLDELWSLLNFILPDIFHDLDLFQQWFNFDELTNFQQQNTGNDDETNRLIEMNIQESLVKNLHTILKPFILRRLKKDVIRNLPPKKEYIIHISLSTLQKKLYNDALNNNLLFGLLEVYLKEYIHYNHGDLFDASEITKLMEKKLAVIPAEKRSKLGSFKEADSDDEFDYIEEHIDNSKPELDEKQIAKLPKKKRKEYIFDNLYYKCLKRLKHLSLQNLIIQLRNICNSPYIFYEPFEPYSNKDAQFMDLLLRNSSKFKVLQQLLDELLSKNHKVLIFSQFTKVLDLINDWLVYENVEICRLDGSMNQSDREEEITEFNAKNSKQQVFLLSTRAGGLGINLTASDTVIIFDNDWNPQIDLQAIDRVHRIGQTKPVKIYRFLIKNSIEEILISKSYSKRFLEKIIIQMGEFKFNKFQKVINEKNLNFKNLVNLSKSFRINGEVKENQSGDNDYDVDERANENKLTDDEMTELLDRSSECYRTEKNFENVSVFETINNMDK